MIQILSVGKISKNKGFTLLELLVVLVIISLMAALVGPRFTGTLSHMSLKTTAKKVAASLRYARNLAVSESRAYISVIDLQKNRITFDLYKKTADKPSAFQEDETDAKSAVYYLPENIRFKNATDVAGDVKSEQFQIFFYPGGSSSGGQVIIADDKEKNYTISIDFITGIVEFR